MTGETVVYKNDLNLVPLRKFTSTEINLFFAMCNKLKEKETNTLHLSFDELKEHGPNGRITQNKLKDNADDFTFSQEDNYIYLKENGKKLVVYIGDKVK